MKHTAKRTLALLLSLSILLSLGFGAVSVSAEGTDTLDILEPVTVGTPLTTSINCRDQVIFNNYNGVNYMYFSAGGTFYVFNVDEYAASPEAHTAVFSDASGVPILRGMAVDSKGNVYAVGDAKILMKYEPATNTVSYISGEGLFDTAWGLDVDENDNIYIAGRPDSVLKYDPNTGKITTLWKGTATTSIRSLTYADGYVYANRSVGSGASTIAKINAATGELVKEASISPASLMYLSVAGNTVFGGQSTAKDDQVILNADTLEAVDVGAEGGVMGFVTEVKDGKAYFIAGKATNGNPGMYSFDVATGKATRLGLTDANITMRCRNAFMTLTIGGTTYENCIMTSGGSGATPRVFNLDTNTTTVWSNFTGSLTEAKTIRSIISGPKGSNLIYVGGYQAGSVAVYNTSTKSITASLFSNGHDQSDSFVCYEDDLYVGCYSGAYVIRYDTGTKKTTNLVNGMKADFNQIRIHDLAAGDGKIFFSTIPNTGALGGCIGWYDLSSGRAYVVPQEGHLYYSDNPGDKENKVWYNAAGQQVDVAAMTFTGIVTDQTLISLQYQNGLLYGASSVSGGSSTTTTQTEAKLMVYDVNNTTKLGDYSISQAVTGIANADGKIPYISGIAPDPDTAGKFWGVVDATLFSFTYDAGTKAMSVKEEISFAKNGTYGNTGSKNWFPRPILFDGEGYMYVGFGSSSVGIRRLKVSDLTVNQCVASTDSRDYALGDDGNLYYMSGKSLMMVALTAVARVEQRINAIGEVTINSSEAITAAREAYNALTAEEKAQVSNYSVLTAAEVAFDGLANQKKAEVSVAYDFYNPAFEIAEGSKVDPNTAAKIEAYATLYAQGTINNHFVGANSIKDIPYITNTADWAGYVHYSKVGDWIAVKLASPGTGTFTVSLDYYRNVNNAKEVSFYILPGDTAVENIATALKTAAAIGTANVQAGSGVQTAELGNSTFEAGKDYILVMKATLNRRGKDLVDTTSETNARMHMIGLDMAAQVATLEDAQAMATTPFHTVKLLYDETANAVKDQIDAIGEVTLKSADAIAEARSAYEALTDLQKPLVTNLTALAEAEAKLAELKASAVTKTEEYKFVYLPPLVIEEGKSYVAVGDTQLKALEEAYAAGTIKSMFMGRTTGAAGVNQTASAIQCNTKFGQWMAFKVKAPGTGVYDIALTHIYNSKNTDECSVYVLPGDTEVANIDTALASATAIGSVNLGVKDPLTNKIGSYQFEAGKDYVIVFKATKDKSGTETAGADAQMRLCGLTMTMEVMSSDLEAAQAVQAKIDGIGDVTPESEAAITAARAAYDALTDDQKTMVSTSALTAAEAKLAELKAAAEKEAADKAAADAVNAKIDAIGEVTLESEAALKAASDAYNALTDDQKALVKIDALKDMIQRYSELVAAAEQEKQDKAAAAAVDAKIAAIGKVALESKNAIAQARADYESLTDAQKAMVSNLKDLEAAEDTYAKLIKDATNPDTGDSVSVMLLAVMALVSVFALAVTSAYAKRRISK